MWSATNVNRQFGNCCQSPWLPWEVCSLWQPLQSQPQTLVDPAIPHSPMLVSPGQETFLFSLSPNLSFTSSLSSSFFLTSA